MPPREESPAAEMGPGLAGVGGEVYARVAEEVAKRSVGVVLELAEGGVEVSLLRAGSTEALKSMENGKNW